MLHAMAQRKAHFLFTHRSETQRMPREDIMTSTIFGPLLLLPQRDRKFVLQRLFRLPEDRLSGDIDLAFWPSWRSRDGRIEPDLIVRLDCSGKEGCGAHVLVEVKWDSPFSVDQLKKQIQAAPADFGDCVGVVTLTKYRGTGRDELTSLRGAAGAIPSRALSWRDVQATAIRLGRESRSDGIWTWAQLASSCLGSLNLQGFQGFGEWKRMSHVVELPVFFSQRFFEHVPKSRLAHGVDTVFFHGERK